MTILIFYAILAVGVSFLCSIAEAVLLSVTPSYVATLAKKSAKGSKKSAALLKELKANIDEPLAAILSLNTIAHTVGATGVGAEAVAIWGGQAVGITSAVMTLVILFLSEIIPKTVGAVYWRSLAPMTARFLRVLMMALRPAIWLSVKMTRLIGSKKDTHVTREEVQAIADLSAESGGIDAEESRVLGNLLRFPTLRVTDIMTPRTVVIAFPAHFTVDDVFVKHPHLPVSRIPIFKDSIDDVVGFILRDDLLMAKAEHKGDTSLESLKREITAVPSTLSLPALFDTMLKKKQQLLLVVDEHGGTHGVVTMEDIVETLLGAEIVDEADIQTDMRKFARERWEARVKSAGILSSPK